MYIPLVAFTQVWNLLALMSRYNILVGRSANNGAVIFKNLADILSIPVLLVFMQVYKFVKCLYQVCSVTSLIGNHTATFYKYLSNTYLKFLVE